MKRLYLILIFGLLTELALAQTKSVVYTYDANGNRDSRTTITLTQRLDNCLVKSDTSKVNDQIGSVRFSIYPNPVLSTLQIELASQTNNTISGKLQLIDISGREVLHSDINSNNMSIDFSQYKTGIYVLQLESGGEKKDFKIIKE